MAQKKKVTVKQSKPQAGVSSITQNNSVKVYSFNPFQPFEKRIQTQNYVIKIKNK